MLVEPKRYILLCIGLRGLTAAGALHPGARQVEHEKDPEQLSASAGAALCRLLRECRLLQHASHSTCRARTGLAEPDTYSHRHELCPVHALHNH